MLGMNSMWEPYISSIRFMEVVKNTTDKDEEKDRKRLNNAWELLDGAVLQRDDVWQSQGTDTKTANRQ